MNMSIQAFAGAEAHPSYDAIVSNPPYFENALRNPDALRMVARHADTLPFAQLFASVARLLTDDGVFSAVIPAESKSRFDEEASLCGLFTIRQTGVKTTPRKPVRRYLVAYAKHPAAAVDTHEEVLEVAHGVRSEWYKGLTRDFYL
jgi:tRNA1Val (adenine37-N6)-methyltransferase